MTSNTFRICYIMVACSNMINSIIPLSIQIPVLTHQLCWPFTIILTFYHNSFLTYLHLKKEVNSNWLTGLSRGLNKLL